MPTTGEARLALDGFIKERVGKITVYCLGVAGRISCQIGWCQATLTQKTANSFTLTTGTINNLSVSITISPEDVKKIRKGYIVLTTRKGDGTRKYKLKK